MAVAFLTAHALLIIMIGVRAHLIYSSTASVPTISYPTAVAELWAQMIPVTHGAFPQPVTKPAFQWVVHVKLGGFEPPVSGSRSRRFTKLSYSLLKIEVAVGVGVC
jgi:hypothetical protein